MKRILYFLFPALIFVAACSTADDLKFEAFNPEVFAFDIGSEYEVNASVRVKGFEIRGEGEKFNSSIGYEIDLVKPDGETVKALLSKIEELDFTEKVGDTGIDMQFSLDSGYAEGKYTIVINLTDNFSGRTTSISSEFSLSK